MYFEETYVHQRYALIYIRMDILSKDISDFAGISQCCLIYKCQCIYLGVSLSDFLLRTWWKKDGVRHWFVIVLNNFFEKAFIAHILWPAAFRVGKIKLSETYACPMSSGSPSYMFDLDQFFSVVFERLKLNIPSSMGTVETARWQCSSCFLMY